ncbi:hypothetical protein RCL1_005600 [Eukaryota sp. TZLM3-RCL]
MKETRFLEQKVRFCATLLSCCNCDSSSEILSLDKGKSICVDSAFIDTLRPPIKIPVQVSPKASIPLSVAFRSFSLSLINGQWEIKHLWKFFLLKQLHLDDFSTIKSKSTISKKPIKSKIIRKLLLRGRYGSAKDSIFSSELAPSNEDSLNQLKALHLGVEVDWIWILWIWIWMDFLSFFMDLDSVTVLSWIWIWIWIEYLDLDLDLDYLQYFH